MEVLRRERDQARAEHGSMSAAPPMQFTPGAFQPAMEAGHGQNNVTTLLGDFARGNSPIGPMSHTGAAQGLVGPPMRAGTQPAAMQGLAHG